MAARAAAAVEPRRFLYMYLFYHANFYFRLIYLRMERDNGLG